jgi:hypothetical protein
MRLGQNVLIQGMDVPVDDGGKQSITIPNINGLPPEAAPESNVPRNWSKSVVPLGPYDNSDSGSISRRFQIGPLWKSVTG